MPSAKFVTLMLSSTARAGRSSSTPDACGPALERACNAMQMPDTADAVRVLKSLGHEVRARFLLLFFRILCRFPFSSAVCQTRRAGPRSVRRCLRCHARCTHPRHQKHRVSLKIAIFSKGHRRRLLFRAPVFARHSSVALPWSELRGQSSTYPSFEV